MSAYGGDKSRHNRLRKQKILRRQKAASLSAARTAAAPQVGQAKAVQPNSTKWKSSIRLRNSRKLTIKGLPLKNFAAHRRSFFPNNLKYNSIRWKSKFNLRPKNQPSIQLKSKVNSLQPVPANPFFQTWPFSLRNNVFILPTSAEFDQNEVSISELLNVQFNSF